MNKASNSLTIIDYRSQGLLEKEGREARAPSLPEHRDWGREVTWLALATDWFSGTRFGKEQYNSQPLALRAAQFLSEGASDAKSTQVRSILKLQCAFEIALIWRRSRLRLKIERREVREIANCIALYQISYH